MRDLRCKRVSRIVLSRAAEKKEPISNHLHFAAVAKEKQAMSKLIDAVERSSGIFNYPSIEAGTIETESVFDSRPQQQLLNR